MTEKTDNQWPAVQQFLARGLANCDLLPYLGDSTCIPMLYAPGSPAIIWTLTLNFNLKGANHIAEMTLFAADVQHLDPLTYEEFPTIAQAVRASLGEPT